jgi:hypothetical protein
MTDRIQELKNQTLDEHFNYTWSTMGYEDISKFAEKFAEMIVQECIETVDTSSVCFTADQVQIKRLAIGKLKRHFGVE